jgi:hypothetical protein
VAGSVSQLISASGHRARNEGISPEAITTSPIALRRTIRMRRGDEVGVADTDG